MSHIISFDDPRLMFLRKQDARVLVRALFDAQLEAQNMGYRVPVLRPCPGNNASSVAEKEGWIALFAAGNDTWMSITPAGVQEVLSGAAAAECARSLS